jgi:galactokinase
VNLIGEHTDYNGGFVFPAAIDQELWLAVAVADTTELHSLELGAAEPFDTATVEPRSMGWATYPAGTAWAFREAGHVVPNLIGVVGSSVPIGAGVSSSAAIEMAFAVAWNHLLGLNLEPLELARLGQRCENGFLGLQSGLMDQMASACGVRGHALLFDTLNATIQPMALPANLQLVICNTGASRELASSKYNERRAECERVCQTLNVPNLRVLDRSRLEQAKGELPEVAYRRARHVLTENERCLEFAQTLRRDEPTDAFINSSASALRRDEPTDAFINSSHSRWWTLGNLMRQSHESLRDD